METRYTIIVTYTNGLEMVHWDGYRTEGCAIRDAEKLRGLGGVAAVVVECSDDPYIPEEPNTCDDCGRAFYGRECGRCAQDYARGAGEASLYRAEVEVYGRDSAEEWAME